jgi:hypothetical protein
MHDQPEQVAFILQEENLAFPEAGIWLVSFYLNSVRLVRTELKLPVNSTV